MRLSKLFVEGELDAQIWQSILAGRPVVERGGSKYGLRSQVVREQKKGISAGYVRDRDFDFDPPDDVTCPVLEFSFENREVGWHWCRHEIENYMLEPAVVHAAIKAIELSRDEYSGALVQAAGRIRHYQSARWVVGQARRGLPPHHELATKPARLQEEFAVPDEILEFENACNWARQSIDDFRNRIQQSISRESTDREFSNFERRFSENMVADPNEVLLWFSGKDLFAALASSQNAHQILQEPSRFRNRIRDWIRDNAENAVELLPEWRAFRDSIRESS